MRMCLAVLLLILSVSILGLSEGIILYTAEGTGNVDIFALDATDGRTWNVTCSPESRDGDAELSPDGEWIAFASNRDGRMEIYVMSIDGSEIVQLDLANKCNYARGSNTSNGKGWCAVGL